MKNAPHPPAAGHSPTPFSASPDAAASPLPGSHGEHELQKKYGNELRARAFYKHQVLDHLNGNMAGYIARQEMMFIGTADGQGETDTSFRAGDPGFVRVIDARTVAFPEFRGNGVTASLGNISENPHISLLFVDFSDRVGLHVNGGARIFETPDFVGAFGAHLPPEPTSATPGGKRPERWVVVAVVEAYIHCSKHIPRLQKIPTDIPWGTDDAKAKGGDYFKIRA